MSEECGSNGVLWFLAGLGVGAALGILYAPKSGRETREAILNAAEQGRDAVAERAHVLREQASEWIGKGKDAISQQKEQLRAAYEAGRHAYQEAAQPPQADAEGAKS